MRARIALLAMLALVGGRQVAQAAFPMRLIDDPVFGLYFAPAKARFETMSLADVPAVCRETLLRDYVPQARFFVYADRTLPTARILILGEKGGGVLLAAGANRCAAGGVLPVLLQEHGTPAHSGDAPPLSPQDAGRVFGDVLVRYQRAFGGKQRFFAWLDGLTPAVRAGCAGQPDTPCPPAFHALRAGLQAMLEAFRRG